MRLDKYISTEYPNKSRSYIQKLIADGCVKINGEICTKSGKDIQNNKKIKITFPKAKTLNLTAKNIPLDIIYEDNNLLIINKPAGLAVHPCESLKNNENTLVNAVLHHCKNDLSGIGGVMRPGIVHRLDKDTSGIMMIAKNDQTHKYLSKLIEKRKIKKIYLALVYGAMESDLGTIDAPIGRAKFDRKKMSIRNETYGKSAITHFKVKKYFKDLDISLLEVQIVTGRTHQIRVHMSSIGHPILFDKTYGDTKLDKELNESSAFVSLQRTGNRQMLHAHKLTLQLPNLKVKKTFEAKIPKEFELFI